MFGSNSWSRSGSFGRKAGIAGIFGGGFRRAAIMGLGMMAYRWWRNRQTAGPAVRGAERREAWVPGTEPYERPVTQG